MSIRALNFCLALVLCMAATAAAQQQQPPTRPAPAVTITNTPTFELSGGYQLLHVPNQTYPFGLNVDAARHYGALGLVGEVGFAYDSEDFGQGIGDLSSTAWNFGVGGRWTGFNRGRIWPFAQVLLGAEILNVNTDIAGVEDSESEGSFMVQPGVGVNLVLGDGFGVVGQIDYRRTFFDELENTEDSINNHFRVFIGARMILD
jgi:hypothetical protein